MTHRIVQIVPSLDRGGAEKQLSLLVRGLPRDEFESHVIVLTRSGPLETELRAADIPLTTIGKRWKFDPPALWRLARELRRLQPALVQTWLFAANAYGRAAAWRAGMSKVVASERCVDRWKMPQELMIDRWLAQRTDCIVVNSTGVSDFYIAQGLPAEKFLTIPNGISPMPPSDRSRAELLAELQLPSDARLIGAVGRLWPQKRYKDLIWAADLLKVIRDDVHLLIVGDGPQANRLRRFRHQVRIEDRVHFLGHRDDVFRLMPHFDVLWLGSEYEGLPNSIMEAMAAGVPVVASDIPGNRDLVVPGETGYLYPVGVRAELARHTRRLLEDTSLAQRMGQAGQARIRAEFSTERMIQRYVDLYRTLLAPKPHGP